MKTQMVDLSGDTVSRALLLNEQLQTLKKKNDELTAANSILKAERDGYLKTIAYLEKGVNDKQAREESKDAKESKLVKDELKKMIESFDILYENLSEVRAERDELREKLEEQEREKLANPGPEEAKRLKEELKNVKMQFDSLYDDLAKVREERDDLKTTLNEHYMKSPGDNGKEKLVAKAAPASSGGSMFSQLSRTTSWRGPSTPLVAPSDQSSFLQQAFQRKMSLTNPNATVSDADRKIRELEVENLKLKSTIVHLQTQMREEKYKLTHQQLDDRRGPARSKSLMLSPREMDNEDDDDEEIGIDFGGVPSLSPLGDDRSFRKLQSKRIPPQRSNSLRRIHEYKAKKETKLDHNSIGTASTSDSSSDPDGPRMFGSLATRSQSCHPTLSRSTPTASPTPETATSFGRSPARQLQGRSPATDALRKSGSGDDMSDLTDSGNDGLLAPKRSQSLIGRLWTKQ
jgi:hypothetical protein